MARSTWAAVSCGAASVALQQESDAAGGVLLLEPLHGALEVGAHVGCDVH